MAIYALSPARTLREPRRLDVRALFGAFLLVAATAGSIAFWSTTSDTREVLVATRDLPAGARLSAGDLTPARVRIDDAMYRAAVPAVEQATYAGRVLNAPVHAHQMVSRAQLTAPLALAPGQLAVTIPVGPEATVGGRIQPGSSVQVIATVDRGKPESRTFVVLPRATVFEVGYDERVAVVNTASTAGDASDQDGRSGRAKIASVSLALDQDQALRLAQARWNAELDIALLPPEG